MEVARADASVTSGSVMLGEVVDMIVGTSFPVYKKLTLAHTVADPIKSHVNGFGALLLDGAVDDACSSHVFRLERSGWLWVAHFE